MLRLKKAIYFILVTSFSVLSSCGTHEEKNTLLIYMCGSDLESEKGYASSNIDELLNADISSNNDIYLLTGGSKKWHKEEIDDGVNLYKIDNHKLMSVKSYGLLNMGEASTLESFISDAKEYQKDSDNYSLIFWDHGAGSLNGVCFDENFDNDSLTLNEITSALKNDKYDFIGFDACLMASYETCLNLKNNTDYLIFSEDLEPGKGWDYKVVGEDFSKENFLDLILESYKNKYNYLSSYTLSYVDLTKFSILEESYNALKSTLINDDTLIDNMLNGLTQFGSTSFSDGGLNLYDLGGALKNLNISFDFDEVIHKVNGVSRENLSGLNFYFPKNENDAMKYASLIDDETYGKFLANFYLKAPEIPLVFDGYTFKNDGKANFIISDSSSDYLKETYYYLLDTGNNYFDDYMYIGADNDFSRIGNLFTVNFNGNWIFLGDQILHCEYLERSDNYTIFYSPILVNGVMNELIFTYNNHTKVGNLVGYIDLNDEVSRINEFEDEDIITPLYVDALSDAYLLGNDFVYKKDETTLQVKTLNDGIYSYYILLEDIFSNFYIAGEVFIEINSGKAEIIDIDNSLYGMLVEN